MSSRCFAHLLGLIAFTAVSVPAADTRLEPRVLEGETGVHDPSMILKEGTNYFLFATGRGIATKSSSDLIHWKNGPAVFNPPPDWTTNAVPEYRGHTWAPDVIKLGDRYLLYYSVSSFGKQVSAIGLATSPTLDPASPDHRWTDHGPVITSSKDTPFNAIDPALFLDRDQRLWMTWGSFWKGIYLVELDTKTGKRLAADSPLHHLAWSQAIEAPAIHRRGDDYFLFVNWGKCCQGTNSTYEVRVGRAKTVTGPYLDRDGVDLVKGGGTKFLETTGRFIGPGHVSVFTHENADWFSYHYYDGERRGRSQLALAPLYWDQHGWPTVKKPATP